MVGRPVPLKIQPGVKLTDSGEAAPGRFRRAEWVRFVDGLPEKMGGWNKRSATAFEGQGRGILAWNTIYGDPRYAFGTHKAFYVSDDGDDFTERTPGVTSAYLTDAISVTNLSPTVTVAHTSHGLSVGDKVMLRGLKHDASGEIGGLDIDGVWTVATVPDVNTYTFTHTSNATATVASGGGRVLYEYSLTNPIATTSGSTEVTVTKTAHGLYVGQWVEISGAATVGGLDLNGVHAVTGVTANDFTFTADSAASSTVAAGGGEVIVEGLLREGRSTAGGLTGTTTYGVGPYGSGAYGTLSSSGTIDPTFDEPRVWSLDTWGQDLVACPLGGQVYYYDVTRPGRMTPIIDAPSSVRGLFVTDERILHVLGAGGEGMKMAWSDQGDLTVWVAADDNQASAGRRLREGSRIMGGRNVGNGLSLIWTDTACYVHQYTGGDLVYDTRLAPGGGDAGLVGPMAHAQGGRNGGVYWLSPNGFRMFDGGVRGLPRQDDVEDYVLSTIDLSSRFITAAMVNGRHNEVWWFFQGTTSDRYPDATAGRKYIAVSMTDYSWSYGALARVAGSGLDRDDQAPILLGSDGYVYEHNVGLDDDAGAAITATLAYAAMGSGAANIALEYFDPDFQRAVGEITISFSAYDADPDTEVDSDSVTYDPADPEALQPRIEGRFIEMTLVSAAVGGDFRMGVPKIGLQERGRRWG